MSDEAGEPVLLYDGGGLRATYRPAPGGRARPLVVTFDSFSPDLNLDRPGFGQAWLAQVGHDAVHVVSDRNAWYQTPETAAACAAIRPMASARRTVTYGSSMGGYAAVRFADRLGAEAAVALSPQFSIDPAKTPFEDRWSEFAAGLDYSWESEPPPQRSLLTAYVLYDPFDRDRLHMERLAALYPVMPLPLPHAGHPAGTFLAEGMILPTLVLSMIDGTFDPRTLPTLRRAARRRSGQYHHVLAQRLPPRRRTLAERLNAMAAELQPGSAVYLSAVADGLERSGELARAEGLRRRALELQPQEPRLRLRLADLLLRRASGRAEAVELAAGIARFGLQRTSVHARACEILIRAGAYEAARDEVREASLRAPRSRDLRRWAAGLAWAMRVPVVGRAVLGLLRRRLERNAAAGR